MKNYELITELSRFPAGADISFDCLCTKDEVDEIENSDDGKNYSILKKICSVYYEMGKIMLS